MHNNKTAQPKVGKTRPRQFIASLQITFPLPAVGLTPGSYTEFQVRTLKMHLYTLCQGIGLAILWIVKSTPAALVFPFFVVFMIPLRLALKFLFTPRELDAVSCFFSLIWSTAT
jgi:ABC-type amino acid transport system permease subunit